MKNLSIADVEFIAFRLAKELMVYDEPIPDFGTRFPDILESCLLAPFQKFEKKSLYQGMIGKASILFYLIIKNRKRSWFFQQIFQLRIDSKLFYNLPFPFHAV